MALIFHFNQQPFCRPLLFRRYLFLTASRRKIICLCSNKNHHLISKERHTPNRAFPKFACLSCFNAFADHKQLFQSDLISFFKLQSKITVQFQPINKLTKRSASKEGYLFTLEPFFLIEKQQSDSSIFSLYWDRESLFNPCQDFIFTTVLH